MVESNMPIADSVWLNRSLRQAVRRSVAAHAFFMDEDDLTQEAWLWVMAHSAKVDEFYEQGRDGYNMLTTSIYRGLHEATMKQRFLKDGTKPGDYAAYSKAMVAELLPDALSPEPLAMPSNSDLNSTIRASKSVAEGGDRLAMLIDVRTAFNALVREQRQIVYAKYILELSDDELCEIFEMNRPTLSRHVTKAIRNMAKYLGPEQPHMSRESMSNAASQVLTRIEGGV